ncbi:MAG: hypothetical protein FJ224_12970 [Lentisphaerae bacterium]|nr:hypothetical protein [Lentisphaerota bacterium]
MAGYLAASFLGEFVTVTAASLTITRLYAGLRRFQGLGPDDTGPFGAPGSPPERRVPGKGGPLAVGVMGLPQENPACPPHGGRIAAFLVLAAVASLATAATILSGFDLQDNVQVTAHRGSSSGAPENTLAAVRRAVEEGADYAEIDVRLTADGCAVLLHERDLFRVAGLKRKVADLTYDQIRTLDVGGWFAPRFRGEPIPLLSEIVTFAQGRIKLNLDLKVDTDPHACAERVVSILQQHDALQDCVVSSANIQALAHIRRLDPSIRTGYIISQSLGKVTALDVDFLSVSSRIATPGLIATARAAGREVHVWTVNHPREMARFIDLGVDNLITARPLVAIALLEKRVAMSQGELLVAKVQSWFLR